MSVRIRHAPTIKGEKMKFGTLKDGKFVEIKNITGELSGLEEPFWKAEDEEEDRLKFKFTEDIEITLKQVTPENLLKVIGAEDEVGEAIRQEVKRVLEFVCCSTDHRARPHKKKRIAKKWAKQGRWKHRRSRVRACYFTEEQDGEAVLFTAKVEEGK